MAIELVASPTEHAGSAFDEENPWTIDAPAGLDADDFALLFGVSSNGAITYLTGGLASIDDGSMFGAWHHGFGSKVAVGSETTFTCSTASRLAGILSAWRGVDSIDGTISHGSEQGIATQVAPAKTPSVDNCVLLVFFEDVNDANTVATPPAGFTAIEFVTDPAGYSITGYYKALGAGSASVSTGTTSLVWTNAASGRAHSLLLKPATAGGSSIAAIANHQRTMRAVQ